MIAMGANIGSSETADIASLMSFMIADVQGYSR